MNFLDHFCGFLREQLDVVKKSINSFNEWFDDQEEDVQSMISILSAIILVLLYRALF